MNQVTEYMDYRAYMRDFYEERKRSSVFSWREFAKLAGFSSSGYLKLVCDGKTRLSRVGAAKVAAAMDLVGFHNDFFLLLVEFCDAINEDARMDALTRLQNLAKENNVRVMGAEAFDYYKSWVNPVVRELAPLMPGAKPSEIAKMCVPEVTAGEVRNALTLMENAGILQKEESGSFRQTDKGISGDPLTVSVAMRTLQKQMAELAIDAANLFPGTERHVSGLTFGADDETFAKLVTELENFRKRIISIISGVKDYNRVYRLNLQFFPLSQKKENPDET